MSKDYKKLYEEALERAKFFKENTDGVGALDISACFEQIFPELKESEDEMIRKSLIALIKEIKLQPLKRLEDWDGMLAWLEKQGEKKGAITVQEVWKDMRLEVYAQASGNRHEANISDDSTKMFSLNDIDEIFEKIGDTAVEQKPAWSEEDEKMVSGLVSIVEDWYNNQSEEEKEYYGDCGYVNFLESLKNRVQPKQEWSKEDYNFIKNLCCLLASISKDGYVGRYYTVDLVEKLKSLKPHWKPSEEQMQALEYAMAYVSKKEDFSVHETIELLYNDLKNL